MHCWQAVGKKRKEKREEQKSEAGKKNAIRDPRVFHEILLFSAHAVVEGKRAESKKAAFAFTFSTPRAIKPKIASEKRARHQTTTKEPWHGARKTRKIPSGDGK